MTRRESFRVDLVRPVAQLLEESSLSQRALAELDVDPETGEGRSQPTIAGHARRGADVALTIVIRLYRAAGYEIVARARKIDATSR